MTAPAASTEIDVQAFHAASFMDLWSPGAGSWYAGVWTGPQHDLICVKKCDTNEECEIWLSPSGATPAEAVCLAVEKQNKLREGHRVCERCGFVGEWTGRWCGCYEREQGLTDTSWSEQGDRLGAQETK